MSIKGGAHLANHILCVLFLVHDENNLASSGCVSDWVWQCTM